MAWKHRRSAIAKVNHTKAHGKYLTAGGGSIGRNVLYTTWVETSPVDTGGNHCAEGAGVVVVALLLGDLLPCKSARKWAGG